ncbi:hypothetical protein MRX96_005979 [Rhipicephalus microplus]
MCSLEATPAMGLRELPEFFIDHEGKVEVIYDGFHVMDTSSTENEAESERERWPGQLGLTAAAKPATQPPEGEWPRKQRRRLNERWKQSSGRRRGRWGHFWCGQ